MGNSAAHALLAHSIVSSTSSQLAAVCRFPFGSNHESDSSGASTQFTFLQRSAAHISPVLSERFVPLLPARGLVSTLFLVRAFQVKDVEMCAHLSTIVVKGWVPRRLGASDGG